MEQITILKLPEVSSRTGLSRSSIYKQINEGTFPDRIKLGERSTGWIQSEINDWIELRISESRNLNEPGKITDMTDDELARLV